MSEVPTGVMAEWQRREVDEAMSVFVRSMEQIGLMAICIVDGRGYPGCMFSETFRAKVPSLLASAYNSVTKAN